jgi:hypothetical protein
VGLKAWLLLDSGVLPGKVHTAARPLMEGSLLHERTLATTSATGGSRNVEASVWWIL